MIAYKKDGLDHLLIHEETNDLFLHGCISKEEKNAIDNKYPVGFYTPNIFIRIGLFVLTLIIQLFSFGLLALIFMSGIENTISGLLIFFSLIAYAALEYMVQAKNHYSSGVDDGLLWGFAICMFAGICLTHDLSNLTTCFVAFIISLYSAFRFADKLMTAIAYVALMGILFFICLEFGAAAKAIVPFVIMAASVVIYFVAGKLRSLKNAAHYLECLDVLKIVSLIGFYIAGNYYVVRELSNYMFHLNLQPGQGIPFGWLFWLFTIAIPVLYLVRGLLKKDIILIRVGLLLFAGIVFTVRYYHTIMPLEILMTASGLFLLAFCYALIKYLHEPKHGFTYQEISKKNKHGLVNIESLIIAETLTPAAGQDHTKFGGGNFGGGGASGDY
jgi:hypothetical protein